jgi:hypothetical protein
MQVSPFNKSRDRSAYSYILKSMSTCVREFPSSPHITLSWPNTPSRQDRYRGPTDAPNPFSVSMYRCLARARLEHKVGEGGKGKEKHGSLTLNLSSSMTCSGVTSITRVSKIVHAVQKCGPTDKLHTRTKAISEFILGEIYLPLEESRPSLEIRRSLIVCVL